MSQLLEDDDPPTPIVDDEEPDDDVTLPDARVSPEPDEEPELLPALSDEERVTRVVTNAKAADPWGPPAALGFQSMGDMTRVLSSDSPGKVMRQIAEERAATPATLEPAAPESALERQHLTLAQQADALVITDAATFATAGELLKAFTEYEDKVRAFLDDDIARAYAAWNGLTKKRKALLDGPEQAKKSLAARYAEFDRAEKAKAEQERQRAELEAQAAEQKRLAEEAAALEAQAAEAPDPRQADRILEEAAQVREEAASVPRPVLPMQRTVAPVKGISTRSNWTATVDDKKALIQAVADGKVSLDALEPNMVYLRARAKADKDTLTMPGVRFYDAAVTSVRR